MRDSFVFYRSYAEAAGKMTTEQKAAFLDVLCAYALDDVEPEVDGLIAIVFDLVKPQIDKSNDNTDKRNGRKTTEYKEWRLSVFERDNYTCQSCGVRGGELNAHHIKKVFRIPAVAV